MLLCTADALFGDAHDAVVSGHKVMNFGRAGFTSRFGAKCPATVQCTLAIAASSCACQLAHSVAKFCKRNASWACKRMGHNCGRAKAPRREKGNVMNGRLASDCNDMRGVRSSRVLRTRPGLKEKVC